jgi:4-amino-4-deoxy-L-arabinose transferase-like glycosyltransferase
MPTSPTERASSCAPTADPGRRGPWRLAGPVVPWSPGQRRALLAIVLGALVLRVGFVLLLGDEPLPPGSDPYFYSRIAENVLAGEGFVEVAARAYRPPGFVAFLTGVYGVFGVDVMAARLALAAVGALHCLVQALWLRRLVGPTAGVIGALLTAVYPQFLRFPQALYTEVLFLLLQGVTLWLVLAALARDGRRSWWLLAVAGVACGATTLTRELGSLTLVAVLIWMVIARRALPGRLRWRAAVFTAATVLTILPWSLRNLQVLGTLVSISTSTGMNLYIGNNPEADGQFVWRLAPGVDWADGAGELQAHRQGLGAAVAYAWEHPGRTVALALRKAWVLWRPPLHGFGGLGLQATALRLAYLAIYLALLLVVIAGWRRLRALWPAPALPLLLLGLATAAHMASFAETRFRVPLEALLIGLAAMVLAAWWPRVAARLGRR